MPYFNKLSDLLRESSALASTSSQLMTHDDVNRAKSRQALAQLSKCTLDSLQNLPSIAL